MACKSCGSDRQRKFNSEIGMHFPWAEGLNKPLVLVFPKVTVCLDCGFGEFHIGREELRMLDEGDVDAAADR